MPERKQPLNVFLVHASSDKPRVLEVYRYLRKRNIQPWLDAEDLVGGQDWKLEISKALRASDVIIICLTKGSVNKEGFVQREIKFALDRVFEQPEGRIFIIPARLEECEIPSSLRHLLFVDVFREDGFERLIKALKHRASELDRASISTPSKIGVSLRERALELETEKKVSNLPLQKTKTKRPAKNYWVQIIAVLTGFIILAGLINSNLIEFLSQSIQDYLAGVVLTNTLKYICLVGIAIPLAIFATMFLVNRLAKQENKIKLRTKVEKSIAQFAPFKNPYIAGNPIDPTLNPRMFFGRSDVVQMVYKEIKEPSQKPSLLLYGRRRMGKTSALLNLGKLMRDLSIVDIYISAQDIKHRTDSDLVFNLVKVVIAKLQGSLSLKQLFRNERKYLNEDNYQKNPVLILSNFFEECNKLLENNSLYCLLMFDEYELLGESISSDFFMQIRDTMQHKPRFVFLFSGTHMPNELPRSNWMEVFMNVKVLPISFLDRQDSYRLLTEPVPDLRYSNEDVIKQILDVTGCQPLLLQSVATEIVNKLNIIEKKLVNRDIVNYAVEKTIDAWGYNFFKHLWEADCNLVADKELLKIVAMDNNKIKVSAISSYIPSLNKLIERDLLIVKNGYVILTMPIVGRWIQRENPKMH